MANVDRRIKVLPTYYLYFNSSTFPQKTCEFEINKNLKKAGREAL